MSKSFTVTEVAKHAKDGESMYIIIDDGVYDITGVCSLLLPSLRPHFRPFPRVFILDNNDSVPQ
jgi:hypothetical protein